VTRSSRILIVVSGYAVALLTALIVTRAHAVATSGPAWQGSFGMLAFGDTALFVGVFALTAMPATGAAFFFLRPFQTLWHVASIAALAIATSGVAALLDYLISPSTGAGLGAWSALAALRILLAPLLAAAYFLALLCAPTRSTRLAFLAATVIETGVFVWVALVWWRPLQ
jgi:hypothetical protein